MAAEFMLRKLLRGLRMPSTDEDVSRLLQKCNRDRTLAAALLSTNTLERLRALRGHIFPFPVKYFPHVKHEVIVAALDEIFT